MVYTRELLSTLMRLDSHSHIRIRTQCLTVKPPWPPTTTKAHCIWDNAWKSSSLSISSSRKPSYWGFRKMKVSLLSLLLRSFSSRRNLHSFENHVELLFSHLPLESFTSASNVVVSRDDSQRGPFGASFNFELEEKMSRCCSMKSFFNSGRKWRGVTIVRGSEESRLVENRENQ